MTHVAVMATVFTVAMAAELTSAADGATVFRVSVVRKDTKDGLVIGKLLVDGKEIGPCYENAERKIPAGKYKGALRYSSSKNFVQGPGGKLGKTGDFLVEVAGVHGRTDILFHAGNKSEHSEGCIMLGPAKRPDGSSDPIAPETLKKLRLLFYDGDDKPSATPDKSIQIEVVDP